MSKYTDSNIARKWVSSQTLVITALPCEAIAPVSRNVARFLEISNRIVLKEIMRQITKAKR